MGNIDRRMTDEKGLTCIPYHPDECDGYLTLEEYEEQLRVYNQSFNKSGLQPIEYKVVIKPDVVTDASIGGIIRPDRVKELEQAAAVRGYLVAAGGKAFEDFGEPIPKIGDRVQFAKYAGVHEVPGADGQSYIMCNDKDIAAIVTEEELVIKKSKYISPQTGREEPLKEKYRFNPEKGNYEREE